MNLEEFIFEFIEDIRNDSIINQTTPSNQFLEDMSNRLELMDYIFNPTILSFYKQGSRNKAMKFDLFAFDEIDKSFVLLSNEFIDDTSINSLTKTDITQSTDRMLNYIDEVYNGTIFKFIDPSQDAYKLALDLRNRLLIDFVDSNNDVSIDKIKLFIVTNKRLSSRVSNLKLQDIYGKQVELNVWDIERIYDIINSGREKEPIVIDINKYNNGKGVSYLKADFGDNEGYDAYLSVLPGKLLSDIYWEHGSRLLEGNVRAFLSAKGKINKAIRITINKQPGKFFAYNNGIACTAKNILFSQDKKYIEKIEDLQIINGGQTTASLTSAWKKDGATLDKIFIPMKLTIIKSDDYDDMIGNISRYANSQNKVTDADLFSNHPFHRKIESISFKTPAPPKNGDSHNTFWYYERSRGKYQQSQFKCTKKSELEAYSRKYPKNQVIVKEDLAKYMMAGEFLRPDLVSRGRAKNMTDFAKNIDEMWKKDSKTIGEKFFKNAVCYAILYKTTDYLVANAEWYNVGGIKLNIVPYTISKIISSIPKGYVIDFNKIWKTQSLYNSLVDEIKKVSFLANEFINDSKGIIVTEYAKKEETWKKFKDYPYEPSKKFIDDLINKSIIDNEIRSDKLEENTGGNVSIEIQIVNLATTENGKYWNRLLEEGIRRSALTLTEEEIIRKYICELSKTNPARFPSQSQFKVAWQVRKKLEDIGVIV